jgi:hypothetical protein
VRVGEVRIYLESFSIRQASFGEFARGEVSFPVANELVFLILRMKPAAAQSGQT